MSKKGLFQTIQFSISTRFSSIWSIERALSGATTPGQSGPGSNGYEVVLRIPQSSCISAISPSDCWVSGQYTELNVKTILIQIIQFSLSTQFKCQNSSILNDSVQHKYAV